jgi:effector-binding domain-containing protein
LITPPQIVESPARTIAFIHLSIPREEIMTAMHTGLEELGTALREQQIAPTGPWFTHHIRRPSESFDLRICFPVARPITPTGRVQAGEQAAATVLRTVYSGNYTGLAAAWGQFRDWIDANNYQVRPDLWEVYLVGPDSTPQPTEWQTQLNRPLA